MKKVYLALIVLFASAQAVLAQSPLKDDGAQFKLASGYTTKGLPLYAAFELGITEDITGGLEYSYRSYKEKTDTGNLSHSISGFSFFGNYYFNKWLKIPDDKWFVYGGINFGYYKWFSPEGYFEKGKSTSTLGVGAQLGGAYYFKNWAVYLEVSGGTENAGGKLGAIYRLPY